MRVETCEGLGLESTGGLSLGGEVCSVPGRSMGGSKLCPDQLQTGEPWSRVRGPLGPGVM